MTSLKHFRFNFEYITSYRETSSLQIEARDQKDAEKKIQQALNDELGPDDVLDDWQMEEGEDIHDPPFIDPSQISMFQMETP